ncbi:MAG: sulfatase [Pirellulales bacterium]
MRLLRHFLRTTIPALLAGCALLCSVTTFAADPGRPNIVIVFADDLGYGDPSCYGNTRTKTPNLDRLAAEGTRFTSFYVPQAVCGALRAALLTGCYSNRIGMLGVPGPNAKYGINPNEKLLSELCREQGYATAIFGKWHLGHRPEFLPLKHGFDRWYGLPYSNDMWPHHPNTKFPKLPLFEGNEIIDDDVTADDQKRLTTTYTERAVAFIKEQREKPFFLYVPHAMPHVPLFTSDKFAGKSEQGVYGDVLMEVDWSVGQILKTLDDEKLTDTTWVIFTSDNGPWLSYGNHAGSAGPLREGKGCEFEGGVRVPCLMRYPGKIPAGRVLDDPCMTIDIFPTIAARIGGALPKHPIDGLDLWPVWSGEPGAKNPHDAYYFYYGNELQAIRAGKWKLIFPHTFRSLVGKPGNDGKEQGYAQVKTPRALYDLDADIGEKTDVQADHPDVVVRLEKLADAERVKIGDSLKKMRGTEFRPPAQAKP